MLTKNKTQMQHGLCGGSLQVMDHLLLGDEMGGLVDQGHEGVELVGPVVEQVVGVLGPLEVDDTGQTVHLGIDGLVHHQGGEKLLRLLQGRDRRTEVDRKTDTDGQRWTDRRTQMDR